MRVQVRSRDLAGLAEAFRREGRRDLGREILKEMRGEVRPIVPEVKAAIRGTPGGTGHQRTEAARRDRPRGLRDAMARGVQVKAALTGPRAGVRIRIDTRHFPDDEKSLPKYREGIRGRWRSKNWGRGWKTQRAHPVFFETIRPHVPEVQAAMHRIAADYRHRLYRGAP